MLAYFTNVNWTGVLLWAYHMVFTAYGVVSQQSQKTGRFLLNSFFHENYLFFENSVMPVYELNHLAEKPGSSKSVCVYSRDTNTLSIDSTKPARLLEFESAEIYHGDICLYNLTNFFSTTQWKGDQYPPNLLYWIGVWSLLNNVYLDQRTLFTLRVITMEGIDHSFEIWSKDEASVNAWRDLTRVKIQMTRHVVPRLPAPAAAVAAAAQTEMNDLPPLINIVEPTHPPPFDNYELEAIHNYLNDVQIPPGVDEEGL